MVGNAHALFAPAHAADPDERDIDPDRTTPDRAGALRRRPQRASRLRRHGCAVYVTARGAARTPAWRRPSISRLLEAFPRSPGV